MEERGDLERGRKKNSAWRILEPDPPKFQRGKKNWKHQTQRDRPKLKEKEGENSQGGTTKRGDTTYRLRATESDKPGEVTIPGGEKRVVTGRQGWEERCLGQRG